MTDKVIVYRGEIGDRGTDAENGAGVSDIRFSVCDNPLVKALFPNNLGDAKFYRGGEAVYVNRYDQTKFTNDFDRNNIVPWSEDFTITAGKWSDINSKINTVTGGQSDPLGGSNASNISLSADTDTLLAGQTAIEDAITALGDRFYTVSFYIKYVSGTFSGLKITIGSDDFSIPWSLSTSWVRVSTVVAPGSGVKVFGISPLGKSGAVFGLFGAQVEQGSNLTDYIATSGAEVTVETTNTGIRESEKGYLIEKESTNLITYSEDLSETDWAISGATLTTYNGTDTLGGINQNILIQMTTNTTATLTKTLVATAGTTYYLSFYAQLVSGSLTNLSAKLEDGTSVEITGLTNNFVRLSATLVAGSDPDGQLVLTMISPTADAQIAILGVQLETDDQTSYMRTANTTITRPADNFFADKLDINPNGEWTVFFTTEEIADIAATRHIFDNGNTSDRFRVFWLSNSLTVDIDGSLTTFAVSANQEIALSHDGAGNIKCYVSGSLNSTSTNAGSVEAGTDTLYFGSDYLDALSIDAYLRNFLFYDEQLTDTEVKYVSGEYKA